MSELTPTVILAICAILTFVATVAGLCTKLFMSKLTDIREITNRDIKSVEHTASSALQGAKASFEAVEQKTGNLVTRIDALERKSDDKETRLVRVEMAIDNIKEGQMRIEQEVKESRSIIEAKLDKRFDMLAESIREIREVKPRNPR